MKKKCQIAIIGENISWILKGLTLYGTDKLILISTNDSRFIEKISEIKNRLTDLDTGKKIIEIEEKVIESKEPLEFIRVLKEIIIEKFEEGYQVDINATAGLRAWQLFGYFTAIQLNKLVQNYFIIDKQEGTTLNLPPVILGKTEQIIIDIINNKKKNIEDIKENYEKIKNKNVSIGLISKYLTKLKEKELISESKVERFKYFELTKLGHIYKINFKYYDLI